MAKTTLQKTSTEALVAELYSRTDYLVVGNIWSANFLTEKYNLDDEMAALFIREQQKACLGLASATDDLHEAMTNFVSTYNDHKQQILDLLPTYDEAVTKIDSRGYNEQGLVSKMRWIEAALTRLKAGGGFRYVIFNILKLMNEVINEANN